MELDEIRNTWDVYGKKLDLSLKLNIKLLSQLNLNKVNLRLRTLLVYKIVELFAWLYLFIVLIGFLIRLYDKPQFSIPAVLTGVFIVAVFVSIIRQLKIVIELRSGYNLPVSVLQKKLETLKILIRGYVKLSLILVPFFPVLMIVISKMLFNVDFTLPVYRNFLLANILVGICLIPAFLVINSHLKKPEPEEFWVKNFLVATGWNQAIAAHKFLEEIKEFEKEV